MHETAIDKPPEDLHHYGILTEKSEVRVHISFRCRLLHVFKTNEMQRFLRQHREMLETKGAQYNRQGRIIGFGFTPTLPHIRASGVDLVTIELPPDAPTTPESGDTSIRGTLAARVALAYIRDPQQIGRPVFPFCYGATAQARLCPNKEMQKQGIDIVIPRGPYVEVKCDNPAGPRDRGGQNKIYLQTHEANPQGMY